MNNYKEQSQRLYKKNFYYVSYMVMTLEEVIHQIQFTRVL